jgi:hypothetical protein
MHAVIDLPKSCPIYEKQRKNNNNSDCWNHTNFQVFELIRWNIFETPRLIFIHQFQATIVISKRRLAFKLARKWTEREPTGKKNTCTSVTIEEIDALILIQSLQQTVDNFVAFVNLPSQSCKVDHSSVLALIRVLGIDTVYHCRRHVHVCLGALESQDVS